eukprot:1350323-Amphidinium_carterae.1
MHPTAPCTPRPIPPNVFHFHPVPPPNPTFTRVVLDLDIDTRMLPPLAPSNPQRPRPHHCSPMQRLKPYI